MQLRKWMMGVLAMVVFCQGGIAYAAKDKPIVTAESKEDFATVAAAVRQQMVPGGRFEFIDNKERDTVNQRLDEMSSLLDRFGSVSQMSQDAKVKLFNDQEQVNAILRHRDDKRLICESVAPTGSHIPRTTCVTYRVKELQRRQAEQFMYGRQSVPQLKNGQ